MVADIFAPVLLAVSLIPNPAEVGEGLALRISATDAARVITADRENVRLRDGKLLCARRDSMAVEYESSHTGAELDQAVTQAAECAAALAGLDTFLAQVVGVPSNG